jgi:hypothetical protein
MGVFAEIDGYKIFGPRQRACDVDCVQNATDNIVWSIPNFSEEGIS